MDNGFVIYLNGKVIGVYNNELLANSFINGGIQNKFFDKKNIHIEKFVMNSCFSVNEIDNNLKNKKNLEDIENQKKQLEKKKQDDELKKKDEIERKKLEKELQDKKKELENSEEFTKIQQEKIDLTQKINEIKYEKKRLDELRQEYDSNLTLYKRFSSEKEKDSKFIIPELFTLKYSIYNKLDKDDNLTFENYKEEWEKVKPKNNYDLFKSNNYEDSFNKKDDSIDEEIVMNI
jgi:hypothetical protein